MHEKERAYDNVLFSTKCSFFLQKRYFQLYLAIFYKKNIVSSYLKKKVKPACSELKHT